MMSTGKIWSGFNVRVLFTLLEVWEISGETLEPIYWNSLNRRFLDAEGYVLYPQIGDRIDLICPQSIPRGSFSTEEYEYYQLYLVSEEQAARCDTVMSPTVLLTCDKPDQVTRFTIKFQQFSPNLWGLEFKPHRNYYIINPNAPPQLKEPSQEGDHPDSGQDPGLESTVRLEHGNSSVFLTNSSGSNDQDHGTVPSSNTLLIAGSAGGVAFLLLLLSGVTVGVLCYRRRRSKLAEGHRPALHLSTLTSPKRGTVGNNNRSGSEPSDIIIPLRTSDSTFCPHYEKVSGDYGHPVYIVQEMPPQSPANIYYKV
ncbi:ephrin-B2-like [Rhincodon typus]|uniref:ephrin-B2-like n=1 Tax=Rhincodon typus TaxID=259920 RepID=UPI00202EEE18|nr:ephrin-B2-like [Rhincodon typus]